MHLYWGSVVFCRDNSTEKQRFLSRNYVSTFSRHLKIKQRETFLYSRVQLLKIRRLEQQLNFFHFGPSGFKTNLRGCVRPRLWNITATGDWEKVKAGSGCEQVSQLPFRTGWHMTNQRTPACDVSKMDSMVGIDPTVRYGQFSNGTGFIMKKFNVKYVNYTFWFTLQWKRNNSRWKELLKGCFSFF